MLPLLGGAPSVWLTTLVFFQFILLVGYGYAHVVTTRLPVRWQIIVHGLLAVAAVSVLPIDVSRASFPNLEENGPAFALLVTLFKCVGFPAIVLATTSPLLQKWLVHSTGEKNPYFLYAASNAGSLLALLGYPTIVETQLALTAQSRSWSVAYGVLVFAITSVGAMTWNGRHAQEAVGAREKEAPIPPTKLLRWLLLAAVPSSLMSGLTFYITTDVFAMPLLWVFPLAIYLLTWIFAFSNRAGASEGARRALVIALVALVTTLAIHATEPISVLLLLHVVTFFLVAWRCHTFLAEEQPPTGHLTLFYLMISIGGVVGGSFNALVAPSLFNSVAEYPLVLAVAAWLAVGPSRPMRPERTARDWMWALVPAPAIVVWFLGAHEMSIAAGIAALVCYFVSSNAVRFGIAIFGLFAGALFFPSSANEKLMSAERDFFGVVRVMADVDSEGQPIHEMFHGSTVHGVQENDRENECHPTGYFDALGPASQIFANADKVAPAGPWALIGLGAGELACYVGENHEATYFEIDPAMVRAASDPKYFTFLKNTKGKIDIVLGDARLTLGAKPDGTYSMVLIDAYSSDSIPLHLITKEAFEIYKRKLKPGGFIAMHLSNRYFELAPILTNLAHEIGFVAYQKDFLFEYPSGVARNARSSDWMVMGESKAQLSETAGQPGWVLMSRDENVPIWTDQFASILSAIRH